MAHRPSAYITKPRVPVLTGLVALLLFISFFPFSTRAGSPDSTSVDLVEIIVKAKSPVKIIDTDGNIRMSKSFLERAPALLGNPDAIRIFQTLPEVRTNNDFSAGISVQGCDYSQNIFLIDGAEVISPFHMLGLFSTFNNSHFGDFSLSPVSPSAFSNNSLGATIKVDTDNTIPGDITADAFVGLLNAGATIKLPVGKSQNNAVVLSARTSYLHKLFPGLLKFDHANILYSFSDINLTSIHKLSNDVELKINGFYSQDKMRISDELYDTDGNFGWKNIMASAELIGNRWNQNLSASFFYNDFHMRQANATVSLPSSIAKFAYSGNATIGHLLFGLSGNARSVSEQAETNENKSSRNLAAEASLSADWNGSYGPFKADIGIKASFFHGKGINRIYPLPHISASFALKSITIEGTASRQAQFTHLIKESSTGLPANFFINASSSFKPQTSWAYTLSLSGSLPNNIADYKIQAYYRSLQNQTEFNGSILNSVNNNYDPLTDTFTGSGRSYGISFTLSHTWGAFQGWIGYNIGRTELLIPEIRQGYFPASYDRRHDFNITFMYRPNKKWNVSASFAYASGTPYTEAAYGYMIGENLICQYFPHNSSRLPDYMRLDLAGSWNFYSKKNIDQWLDISLYNATVHENVMLLYYTFSPDDGLTTNKSSFKSIIPSISYRIHF